MLVAGGEPRLRRQPAVLEVLDAVRAIAAADPDGIAQRWAIIAATPDVAAPTRDLALGDLVADGKVFRLGGVYKPAPPTEGEPHVQDLDL